MTTSLSKDSVTAHEAVSMKISIEGRGNLNLIETPLVRFPADFETYDVKKSDQIKATASGFVGTRVYEYPFIPRSQGDYEIPAVEFTYFDIKSNRYKTITSEPASISVKASSESPSSLLLGVSKQNVKNLTEDIRFITTSNKGLKMGGSSLVASKMIYLLQLLVVLLFFVASYFIKRNIRLNLSLIHI